MSGPFVFRGGHHSAKYANNYSEEENSSFEQQFGAITMLFVQGMEKQLSPDAPEIQAAVKAHFDFCSRFWAPSRSAYKSLGMSYVLPTPYRDAYENVRAGLGQYTYEALVIWADANLFD